MAEKNEHLKNEQNTSQHLNAQQKQHHLHSAAVNFTTNNFSKFGNFPDEDRKIHIGGLKEEITRRDLKEHFGKFGEIKYIDFKVDNVTGLSKGYAFVVYKKKGGKDNALACDTHFINYNKIEVNLAKPRGIKLCIGGQHLNSAAENFTTNESSKFENVPENERKIYIGALKEEITERDLKEHFGKFGEIECIDFKVDTATGRSRGFSFVIFKTKEGLDNALACNNHVINDLKTEPKKAIPQRNKLFVGGLISRITDDDIKDYFKRYTHHNIILETQFDIIKNKRKGYCYVTIEDPEAVTEILRLPRHLIREKEVDVSIAEVGFRNKRFMPSTLEESMNHLQGNVMGQEGFLPQAGYTHHAPGSHYGGYSYYQPYTGNYPNYHYSYGYPSYVAGAEAGARSEGNEASGVSGNQIGETLNIDCILNN